MKYSEESCFVSKHTIHRLFIVCGVLCHVQAAEELTFILVAIVAYPHSIIILRNTYMPNIPVMLYFIFVTYDRTAT